MRISQFEHDYLIIALSDLYRFDIAALRRMCELIGGCFPRIFAGHINELAFGSGDCRAVPNTFFDKCSLAGLEYERRELVIVDWVVSL